MLINDGPGYNKTRFRSKAYFSFLK